MCLVSLEDPLRQGGHLLPPLASANSESAGKEVELQVELLRACRKGDKPSVQAILDDPTNDVSVNAVANQGEFRGASPLHVAVAHKQIDIVLLLLHEYQANPNIQNTIDGTTPLHTAVRLGTVQDGDAAKARQIQLLLHFGADPNIETKQGQFVLHMACHNGCLRHIQRLVAHHAQIEQADRKGWTPLTLACAKGHLAVVQWLLSTARCNPNKSGGGTWEQTPLAVACRTKNINIVALLFQHGAKLPPQNDDKSREVLAKATNSQGQTLLHCLCKTRTPNLIAIRSLLIFCSEQLNINATDYRTQSALHLACSMNALELVQLLLRDPLLALHGPDSSGDTPLNLTQSPEVARALLSDDRLRQRPRHQVHCPNHAGETPLAKATREFRADMVRVLLEFGADPSSFTPGPLVHACAKGCTDIVDQLLAYGASPNGNGTQLPLHAACRGGHYKVVLRLLDADVNAVDPATGDTALHVACHEGHVNIVEYLVKVAGARLDVRNHQGQTPLEVAQTRLVSAPLEIKSSAERLVKLPVQEVTSRGGKKFPERILYWKQYAKSFVDVQQ